MTVVPFPGSKDATPEERAMTAGRLRFIADKIESGVWNLQGYAIIGIAKDGPPQFDLGGNMQWDDLGEVQSVIRDVVPSQWTGDDILISIKSGWERRKAYREQMEAREAADLVERPWLCEACARRFRTERGALQHERHCQLVKKESKS